MTSSSRRLFSDRTRIHRPQASVSSLCRSSKTLAKSPGCRNTTSPRLRCTARTIPARIIPMFTTRTRTPMLSSTSMTLRTSSTSTRLSQVCRSTPCRTKLLRKDMTISSGQTASAVGAAMGTSRRPPSWPLSPTRQTTSAGQLEAPTGHTLKLRSTEATEPGMSLFYIRPDLRAKPPFLPLYASSPPIWTLRCTAVVERMYSKAAD